MQSNEAKIIDKIYNEIFFFPFFSSPHAELMRKRNNIIFNLVESERDYNHQLEILVANYVRPFRMGKINGCQ